MPAGRERSHLCPVALAPMSTETPLQEHRHAPRIESGTGTSLAAWVHRIDDAGGRELDHTAIARLLPQRWEISEWWAQGVTIAYEQLIGRRVVGQSCAGDFAASASRILPAIPMPCARSGMPSCRLRVARSSGSSKPSLSDTPKWRYWRAAVSDGSRGFREHHRQGRGAQHPRHRAQGLEIADAREVWKTAWKTTLTDFTTFTDVN